MTGKVSIRDGVVVLDGAAMGVDDARELAQRLEIAADAAAVIERPLRRPDFVDEELMSRGV